jgi:hypothetical protein
LPARSNATTAAASASVFIGRAYLAG